MFSLSQYLQLPNIQPIVDDVVDVFQSIVATISAEGGAVVNTLIDDVTQRINSTVTGTITMF